MYRLGKPSAVTAHKLMRRWCQSPLFADPLLPCLCPNEHIDFTSLDSGTVGVVLYLSYESLAGGLFLHSNFMNGNIRQSIISVQSTEES